VSFVCQYWCLLFYLVLLLCIATCGGFLLLADSLKFCPPFRAPLRATESASLASFAYRRQDRRRPRRLSRPSFPQRMCLAALITPLPGTFLPGFDSAGVPLTWPEACGGGDISVARGRRISRCYWLPPGREYIVSDCDTPGRRVSRIPTYRHRGVSSDRRKRHRLRMSSAGACGTMGAWDGAAWSRCD
jgi:hypothetical protein